MAKVILHGGGEHARVVLDSLLSQGASVIGLFDPKYSGELFGIRQLGEYNASFDPEAKVIVAIGDNLTRMKAAGNTRHAFTTCIDRSAVVSPFARIGLGSMILHGVIVQAQSVIGNHVILNTGARIDHDCIIEDFVHVAPGVTLCGAVHVGKGTLIGAAAVVLRGVKIGSWAVIGAGAVVTKDVPDNACVVGNPAKPIKPGEQ